MQFGPPDDPPLELAERPPPRKLREEPQPVINTYPIKRKLFVVLKVLGVLVLLAVGAYVFFYQTETGREIRPAGALYQFTDDQGVPNIVDDLDKIPEKHRAKAKRLDP